MKQEPYIVEKKVITKIIKHYNPKYGDEKLCECGHTYYRHFDSYEGMLDVGCKYCGCEFIPKKE